MRKWEFGQFLHQGNLMDIAWERFRFKARRRGTYAYDADARRKRQ